MQQLFGLIIGRKRYVGSTTPLRPISLPMLNTNIKFLPIRQSYGK